MGDYVTHIDHGIGKFGGLQKIDVQGKMQEAIKLVYKDSDILYVSIHSLHKIAKFNGKEGATPVLNKLGSPAWQALKKKTKTRVKQMAYDLIQLYAKRKRGQRAWICADTYLQHELGLLPVRRHTRSGKGHRGHRRIWKAPSPWTD